MRFSNLTVGEVVWFRWIKKPAGKTNVPKATQLQSTREWDSDPRLLDSRVSGSPSKPQTWPSQMPDTQPTKFYPQLQGLGSSPIGSSLQPSAGTNPRRGVELMQLWHRVPVQDNGDQFLWDPEGSSQEGPVKSVMGPLSEGFPTLDHSCSDQVPRLCLREPYSVFWSRQCG